MKTIDSNGFLKILVLCTRIPAPGKKGDQVVSFYRLMHLAKSGHAIKLICFGNPANQDDAKALVVLEAAGIDVELIRWNIFEAFYNFCRALPNSYIAFQAALYKSTKFSEKVSYALRSYNPDVLYCVMIRVAENIPAFDGNFYVDLIDSMGLNFSRRVNTARGVSRWALSIERDRVSAYERNLANRSRYSFVVSEIDRQAIGAQSVHVIPLGVDLDKFNRAPINNDHPVIVFTGNMGYRPNIDAVIWFLKNCWTNLKLEAPGIKFLIAGSNPHSLIASISSKDPDVSIIGKVPSIAAVLNESMISIAPMQSGSGMQFKILEAMACGVPVVTTTLGLGDIHAIAGRDLLVSDAPNDFTASVLYLIENSIARLKLGNSGLDYVCQSHSWDAVNQTFENYLLECIEMKKS